MSKSQDYYCHPPMSRTLEEIKKCAWKQNLSCVHQPLVDIPLENIILDELHLMLRVTGNYSMLSLLVRLKGYTLEKNINIFWKL